MKKAYSSPEVEIEKFSIRSFVMTTLSNDVEIPGGGDFGDPGLEGPGEF